MSLSLRTKLFSLPPHTAPLPPQNHLTMADKAVEGATTAMAEVRLDENGQPLSKNALKKLLKAEAAAKKKAEKAAAKVSDYYRRLLHLFPYLI